MKLVKFYYAEHLKNPRAWELKEFDVNDINLIVGANASGKSRTLNVIAGLSRLLLESKIRYLNGTYRAQFISKDKKELVYFVQLEKGIVHKEELFLNGVIHLKRSKNGEGKIKGLEIGRDIKFKIPTDELAALRRDEIQHPFLNYLFEWASNLRHFRFAQDEAKRTLVLFESHQQKKEEIDLRETDRTVVIFKKGLKRIGDTFLKNIIKDFNKIGYSIQNVSLVPLIDQLDSPLSSKLFGLSVKENDREGETDQRTMSEGMFRALSIIIDFNYYQLSNLSDLFILIDDIGEGLDYERSTKLIKLIIKKSIKIGLQLVMATNNKFVMNNTKLEYWQLIHRKGGVINMHNISNSLDILEQFKFTGLNNFDYFSTNFFKTGLK